MLFDPRPKSSRKDLFDREKELELLHRFVEEKSPLIILVGVRRIGKTSLLRVFLNEVDTPYILLDTRGLPLNYGLRDLYRLLSEGMSNKTFIEKMQDVLSAVKGIKIYGFEVELAWRGKEALSLPILFDYLNKKRVIVAIDEAQGLRGPRGTLFLEAIAHAYDYDDNLTFILTGSEVGLLLDYLGLDNPASPLYGRVVKEIVLERFTREQSIEFMKRGLEEAGLDIPLGYIEEVVDFFDGIPGWLTLVGHTIVSRSGRVNLEELRKAAVDVALRELQEIVKLRGRRYGIVLKLLAQGYNTWGRLKSRLEEVEGKTVSNNTLYTILRTLEKLNIIRGYEFLDPVYREAAKML